MNLFIVHGCTGEYEDFHSWEVAAFSTRRRANQAATDLGVHRDQSYIADYIDFDGVNPYDSKMTVDWTGVKYWVQSGVPLDPPLPRKDGR